MLFNFLVQAPLDVEIFYDRFNNQIAVLEFLEVVLEISDGYQTGLFGSEQCGRLCFFGRVESGLGNAITHLLRFQG